ncbi:unnamed protein product [Phytophthora fragariaefolia]|uniref:Unnamed protein product n=1 Tax=Phytophthora fragariaefolia TaxID=1490495 RepID=A0A9W7CVG0_9STRA|nr:unnamed protein product [Phytophthora fragariaefolia]
MVKLMYLVRLATGSIVSTRKVVLPLKVKFDDFDSVEPFIVLDMDDRYDPWHKPLADRALMGHVPSASRDGFVHEHRLPLSEQHIVGTSEVAITPLTSPPWTLELGEDEKQDPQIPIPTPVWIQGPAGNYRVATPPQQVFLAGSAHGIDVAGVGIRAEEGGRAGAPITQGVGAESAHADESAAVAGAAQAEGRAGVGARADNSDRVGAPTTQGVITGSDHAERRGECGVSAPKDETLRVLDGLTGKPKVGVTFEPLPSVAELLELEELSYLDFLKSLKAGVLEEVVLIRAEHDLGVLTSSSVMDPEVLEDERTSRRKMRYGYAILQNPSDPYYGLIKEFSDDNPPSVLPPDRGVRHEIDLVPGTKYCTTKQWSLLKEQVDVIDAFFAAKHAAGMVRVSNVDAKPEEGCIAEQHGGLHCVQRTRHGRWLLSVADAGVRYSAQFYTGTVGELEPLSDTETDDDDQLAVASPEHDRADGNSLVESFDMLLCQVRMPQVIQLFHPEKRDTPNLLGMGEPSTMDMTNRGRSLRTIISGGPDVSRTAGV